MGVAAASVALEDCIRRLVIIAEGGERLVQGRSCTGIVGVSLEGVENRSGTGEPSVGEEGRRDTVPSGSPSIEGLAHGPKALYEPRRLGAGDPEGMEHGLLVQPQELPRSCGGRARFVVANILNRSSIRSSGIPVPVLLTCITISSLS